MKLSTAVLKLSDLLDNCRAEYKIQDHIANENRKKYSSNGIISEHWFEYGNACNANGRARALAQVIFELEEILSVPHEGPIFSALNGPNKIVLDK